MNIVLSYIGPLPEYIILCIQQIRLFAKTLPIYLIIDDLRPMILLSLEPYNINIINYETVKSTDFLDFFDQFKVNFSICDDLGDRKFIFMRSVERFFLLYNLMLKESLTDVLFMEIDNTIYDDPENWLKTFQKYDLVYMFDNEERYSSGIFYTRCADALTPLLNSTFKNVNKYSHWYSDMTILYELFENDNIISDNILILPTHTGYVSNTHKFNDKNNKPHDTIIPITYKNYGLFGDSIFDAAGMGVYLFGCDPFHSGGIIKHNFSEKTWSHIYYPQYTYKWELDSENRKIPYINFGDDKWIRINNLHIHSKDLKSAMSIDT